ncbi:MAG TPA: SURF1 family protein [Alphaproteobacteria bacterium]|nr:SURF1 family protein [Alphaproteobacteria bacterium]
MARFRPTLLPTLITLSALLVLLGLGTWQVQRLHWKESLIAEREAQLAAPPAELPGFSDAVADRLAHRRFVVRGVFLHHKTLLLGARAVGGVPGMELLTPLKLDDGRILMVNRGWVPMQARGRAAREETLPEEPVAMTGILRPPATGNWFTPEPDLKAGHWFAYDVAAMARFLQLPLQPAVLEALPDAEPGPLPLARTAEVNLVNHHLQYAITWFALAAVLIVIYALYHLQRQD